MKHFFIFLLAISLVSTVFGQSTRLVLVEEGTNASCGPCAGANPALNTLLDANADFVTAIKYQWYFPGFDPMHNHNPEEANARVSYYGINGVPAVVVDGNFFQGHPNNLNQGILDQAGAVESSFELTSAFQISPDQSTMRVQLLVKKTGEYEEPLRAQMVVIEEEIQFATAPGGNGETEFFDVMKKLLPNQYGTMVPEMEVGDYTVFSEVWECANVYEFDELSAVCFLQANSNKNIAQASNSTEGDLAPIYTKDVAVAAISDIIEQDCNGIQTPIVAVNNFGEEAVSTITFEYVVNGGDVATYEWTGAIETWETADITLPAIEYTVEDMNELVVDVVAVNGSADDFANNNVMSFEFERAMTVPGGVKMMMRTDENPEETTWEIINTRTDEVVASGGPYADPITIYEEDIALPEFDCYEIRVYDAGGNGLAVPGFIAFGDPDFQFYIIEANTFGFLLRNQCYSDDGIGVDVVEEAQLNCYPNPVEDRLVVSLANCEEGTLAIFNIAGQKVIDLGNIDTNESTINVDVSALTSGIYFVKLASANGTLNQKILIAN